MNYTAIRPLLFIFSFAMNLIAVKSFSQTKTSVWEFSLEASGYARTKVQSTTGEEKPNLHPCVGWNLGIQCRIFERNNHSVVLSYFWGHTPYFLSAYMSAEKYPSIPFDVRSRFYTLHSYNFVGVGYTYALPNSAELTVTVGNRFYKSSEGFLEMHLYDDSTMSTHVLFSARIRSSQSYLCPEIGLRYSRVILLRYPSWRWSLRINLAPIKVLKGEYVFSPENSAHLSKGNFELTQDYVGLGIIYRRVKKVD